ncbi:MAG: hypothetical protein K2X74_06445 [Acetobacteraceae bacterium]|nr:hypothetical protein [Acetobacteraceae bacterium]
MTAAEYAVLGTAIVIIVAAAVTELGDPVNGAFARVGTVITDAVNDLISTGAGLGSGSGSALLMLPQPGGGTMLGAGPDPQALLPRTMTG